MVRVTLHRMCLRAVVCCLLVLMMVAVFRFHGSNQSLTAHQHITPQPMSIEQQHFTEPAFYRNMKALPDGFHWLMHEAYDRLNLTVATDEAIVEKAVFAYMKQRQIRCPNPIRIGRKKDGGWDVCNAGPFRIVKPCLVYSIGMGGEWSFDEMITTKYGCQDMAYDPSIGKPDHRPNPLLWFFNTGLGGSDEINSKEWRIRTFPSLMKENNHTQTTIDILKMDIEYSEWSSLQAMLDEPSCLDNVKQLMIEFHTRELKAGSQSSIEDLLSYWNVSKGLDRLGFKLWKFWNNVYCTFVSSRTPGLKLCGCFNAYYVNTRLL